MQPEGSRGAFEILEIPAAGAYGTVCVARINEEGADDGEGRVVALKVLKADYVNAPGIVERARDEARMLFRIRHPNIVRVEQLVDVGGRAVMIMEWVEGVTLKKLIERIDQIPGEVIVEVARQAALALDAAYNSPAGPSGGAIKVIHRDIKPANILLSLRGEVKVVDFGVAKGEFDDREHSTISTIMGSHGYIAPERLEGAADTPAVDVYSLGVTLFEMAFGHPIFLPRNPDHHDRLLAEHAAEFDAEGLKDGRPLMQELLKRMCCYDRTQRPSHAEVAEELGTILKHTERLPDLWGFAESTARKLYEGRPCIPPKHHPEYPSLAFLEEPWEGAATLQSNPESVPTTIVDKESAGDRRVRRLLAREDWETRLKDLLWLLATNTDWTDKPFLEVLELGAVPRWKFWARRASAAQVAAALQMLKHRRTPAVLDRAKRLSASSDAEVSAAAKALLEAEKHDPRSRRRSRPT